MSQFQVDSDAMVSTTNALRDTVTQMQSLMANMHGNLNALAQAWSGSASLAFQDLVADWQVTQRIVEGNLDEISVALSTAHDQYADVEAANLRLFGR